MTSCQIRLAVLAMLAGACLPGAWANEAQPASSNAFVRAAQKPNGSGVEVRYRVLDRPAVGQSTRVEIALGKISDSSGATVQLTTDAGLRLESPASTTVPAGKATTLTVSVVPQAEGLAYLNVFTRQRGAASSTSIAIQTGPVTGASRKTGAGKLKDGPEGDKILAMPVK